jgi:hypothetical protein
LKTQTAQHSGSVPVTGRGMSNLSGSKEGTT